MQFIFRNKVKILIGLILIEIFLNSIILFFDFDNKPLLYAVELISSVAIVILATTFINKVSFFEFVTSRSESILNSAPSCFISYEIKTGEVKASKLATSLFKIDKDSKFQLIDLKQLFEVTVWNEIQAAINGAPINGINGVIKYNGIEEIFLEYDIKFSYDISKKVSYVIFWFRDRTDIIKQEKLLLKGYQKYQKLSYEYSVTLKNLTCPVWMIDRNDEFSFTNNYFEKMASEIGFTLTEFKKSVKSLYDKKNQNASISQRVLKKLLVGDSFKTYCFEQKEIHPQIGKVGFCYDVTEFESSLEKLKNIKAILDNAIESMSNPILILDKDMTVFEWNSSFINFFNISKEILEKSPTYSYIIDQFKSQSLFPELKDYREKHLSTIKQATSSEDMFIHLPDGRTINLRIHPIKNGQTVLVFENITINLEMERAVKDSESTQVAIFDSMPFPAIILNVFGKIELVNKRLLQCIDHSEFVDLGLILSKVLDLKSVTQANECASKIINLLNIELINAFEEGLFVINIRKLPNSKHLITFEPK